MIPHISEEFSTRLVDRSLFVLTSDTKPPRDPNQDQEDEDDEDDSTDELSVVREPDEN